MSDTKVIINACYGGFSLDDEAKREYLRRTGQTWTEEDSGYRIVGPNFYVEGKLWTERTLPRTDPALIALVEEWGDRANGMCANLKVETVPEGSLYRIDEYDGFEGIEYRDDIDWETA